MLTFLVVIFLVITITCVVNTGKISNLVVGQEDILFGVHQCSYNYNDKGNAPLLIAETWILTSVWEVLVLSLAAWVAVNHFRELRSGSPSTVWSDCFMVLLKSHVFYFAAFVVVSCFTLGELSPKISDSSSLGTEIYFGFLLFAEVVQMFVLGPRLILSVRAYHTKLVDDSDEGTAVSTIAFQERVQESTGCV